jgi:hypothetical protein
MSSPEQPSPKRTDRRATASPQKVKYRAGSCKADWTWPLCKKEILIIGDSNLARITKQQPVNVQIESFAGATFQNFTNMLKNFDLSKPQPLPDKILVSLGINDRCSDPGKTSCRNFQTLVYHLNRIFPDSEIYFAELNFSDAMRQDEKRNLKELNKAFLESQNIKVIPKLDKIETQADHIHWIEHTANRMLDHWLSHLN